MRLATSDTFHVISIDPGTNIGISVCELHLGSKTMHVLESFTIDLSKHMKVFRDYEIQLTKKYDIYYNILLQLFKKIINEYHTDVVVYESNYFSSSMNAYKSLLMFESVILNIFNQIDPLIVIGSVSPSSVKKALGVKGNSGDKTLVSKAVLTNKHIVINNSINHEEMTEHSWDSIAIGYYALCDFLKTMEDNCD